MSSNHKFEILLKWKQKDSSILAENRRLSKNHTIEVEGKDELNISAAKTFKGDPSLYNPEDLLLSSLASCHMMSYLYCCEQEGIDVLSYADHAEAVLEVHSDGSGRITKVKLQPEVVISNKEQIELAIRLHQKANKLCFIANSCNFPIDHNPTCKTTA